MADWSQLAGITDPNQYLQQLATNLWGQASTPITEEQYWNQNQQNFTQLYNPLTGEVPTYEQLKALTTGKTSYDPEFGQWNTTEAPYTTVQNAYQKYLEENPSTYSGLGYMYNITGVPTGTGLNAGMSLTDLASKLVDSQLGYGMDSSGSYVNMTNDRIGDPNYSKTLSMLQNALPNLKLNTAPEGYGDAYYQRKALMDAARRENSGSFMESLMNQATKFIPGISEARNIAEGIENPDWTSLDKLINIGKNVVAPYIHSSGDYVSREIGKAVPADTKSWVRPIADLIGTAVYPGAGTMAANSIVNSVYGDYQKSPTKSSIGTLMAGGAAYLASSLSDLLGGLSAEDLGDALNQVDIINAANAASGEVPTQISKEAYDALYGGIEPGTFTGDLETAYAHILSDVGQYTKPNANEWGYINDTSRIPGINVPETGVIDLRNATEADLIKAEAERDAALQGLNPPKEPYYFKPLLDQFNPQTGQLDSWADKGYFDPLNEQFNPSTGELDELDPDHAFTNAMSQEQMDQVMQQGMNEAPENWWESDVDWNRVLKEAMKLGKNLFGGNEQELYNTQYYMLSPWTRGRMGGSGIGEEGVGGWSRTKNMKGSNLEDDMLEGSMAELAKWLFPDLGAYRQVNRVV